MENEIQPSIPSTPLITPTPTVVRVQSTNWSKIILFTLLGLIIILGSVFIGIQIGKNQTPTPKTITLKPTSVPVPSLSAAPSPVIANLISDWLTYQDKYFTIKYPSDWRYINGDIGGGYHLGFGPKSVAEDTFWGIFVTSKTGPGSTTLEEIKDSLGKQFPDRVQKQTSIVINGLPAIIVTTTVPSKPDWYYQVVIVERPDGFIQITNGAFRDEDLQKKYRLTSDINFENFYKSLVF